MVKIGQNNQNSFLLWTKLGCFKIFNKLSFLLPPEFKMQIRIKLDIVGVVVAGVIEEAVNGVKCNAGAIPGTVFFKLHPIGLQYAYTFLWAFLMTQCIGQRPIIFLIVANNGGHR